jgi:hypothetical protein
MEHCESDIVGGHALHATAPQPEELDGVLWSDDVRLADDDQVGAPIASIRSRGPPLKSQSSSFTLAVSATQPSGSGATSA